MNRLKDMREGSVKVRIEGRGMERFFNIAAQRGITITEIETKETKKAYKEQQMCLKELCRRGIFTEKEMKETFTEFKE